MNTDVHLGALRPEPVSASATETPPFLCSLAQERFWVLDRLNPGSGALNIAVRWQLDGPLDADLLEHAIIDVIKRHEILSTAIVEVDGAPLQLLAEAPFTLACADLAALPDARRDAELHRLGAAEAHRPFDIARAPLLRATLVRLAPARAVLLLTAHHLVADGWSMGVLARDIMTTHQALAESRAPLLPPLHLQYGDYALWQRDRIADPAFATERAYWLHRLAGLAPPMLPTDRPRGAVPTTDGEIASFLLPRPFTDRLEAAARRANVTLFTAALAGLVALLHRLADQADIAVGTQMAGRDHVELEDMVGPFINTLVLRVDASGDPSLAELLARAHAAVQGAMSHRQMPIEEVLAVHRARAPGRAPLFAANLIFQRSFIRNETYGNVSLTDLPSHSAGALYDLNFFMVERPEGWRASCEYSSDLYEKATVLSLLEGWQAAMTTLSTDPAARLATLQLPLPYARRPDDSPGRAPARSSTDSQAGAETRLREVWSSVLGLSTVGLDDNFFELGGHSLLAARLIARIEAAFGVRLRLAALFDAPTIRALAPLVMRSEQKGPEPFQVLRVQPNGARAPILAIHNAAVFHPVARRLGTDQPFTALQLIDPDVPQSLPTRTLEAIAADYVRLLVKVQPNGPFVLVGWCIAGVLAYEIAQQLRAAGHEIRLLVMIDTWAPGYSSRLGWWQRGAARLSYWTQSSLRLLGARRSRAALRRIYSRLPFAGSATAVRAAREMGLLDTAPDKWLHEYLEAHERRYRPTATDAPVLLIRRSDMPRGPFLDAALGWRGFATGRLEVREAPGDHLGVLSEPGAGIIAKHIAAELSRAAG